MLIDVQQLKENKGESQILRRHGNTENISGQETHEHICARVRVCVGG